LHVLGVFSVTDEKAAPAADTPLANAQRAITAINAIAAALTEEQYVHFCVRVLRDTTVAGIQFVRRESITAVASEPLLTQPNTTGRISSPCLSRSCLIPLSAVRRSVPRGLFLTLTPSDFVVGVCCFRVIATLTAGAGRSKTQVRALRSDGSMAAGSICSSLCYLVFSGYTCRHWGYDE
jgi:hypothetical protein